MLASEWLRLPVAVLAFAAAMRRIIWKTGGRKTGGEWRPMCSRSGPHHIRSRSRIALMAALCVLAGMSGAGAEEKKIVLDGKFGQIVSDSISRPPFSEGVELGQEVRIDNLTSSDPDWDGATATIYEQNLSYPSNGTNQSFVVLDTPGGDKAFLQFTGKWDVVRRDGAFVEAPFAGEGKLTGGTGKFQSIAGRVVVKGKVTPENTGEYSVEITALQ
jgi:hypothetical protein